MTYYFGEGTDRRVSEPTGLIRYLPDARKGHYRDGFSMAETAKAWFCANGLLPVSIAGIVGSDSLDAAHFEYPTVVWGRGTSMTDVMAFVPGDVIAIEGKAREAFGPEVGIWIEERRAKNERSPAHRQKIMKRYARALGIADEQSLSGLRYQLFHRTLSAALAAQKKGYQQAWMIVQSFAPLNSPEHGQNHRDFDRFLAIVGSAPILNGVTVRIAWAQEGT